MVLLAKWFLALAVMVALAACSGLVTPRNFEDRLAYAHGTLAAAYETIASLTVRDRITPAKATEYISKADDAGCALNVARYFHRKETGPAPDCSTLVKYVGVADNLPQDSMGWLQLSITILTDLEAELKSHGG